MTDITDKYLDDVVSALFDAFPDDAELTDFLNNVAKEAKADPGSLADKYRTLTDSDMAALYLTLKGGSIALFRMKAAQLSTMFSTMGDYKTALGLLQQSLAMEARMEMFLVDHIAKTKAEA